MHSRRAGLLVVWFLLTLARSVPGRLMDLGEEKPATPQPVAKARTDSFGDPLPEGAVARIGTRRLRAPYGAYSFAFSADGRLFTSNHGDAIYVWETATGKLVRRLDHPSHPSSAAYFSADAKTVTRVLGATVREWEIASGKEIRSTLLPEFPTQVFSYHSVLSSDCRLVVGSAIGHPFRVWDAATGKPLGNLPRGGDERLFAVAWVPGTKTLGLLGTNEILLWDVASGKQERLPFEPTKLKADLNQHTFRWLEISPDGKTLALVDGGTEIRLLDRAGGKEVGRLRGHQNSVCRVRFSPGGKTLASLGSDRTIRVWNLATYKETVQIPAAPFPNGVAFSPDSQTLVSHSQRSGLRLWEVATGKERLPLPGPWYELQPIGFLPGGKTLVGLGDGGLRFWDAATGIESAPPHPTLKPSPNAVLSPDGKTLVEGRPDQSVDVWEMASGKKLTATTRPLKELIAGSGHALAFSPDGKMLADGSGTGRVTVYDATVWKKAQQFQAHDDQVIVSTAFSPDSKTLATGGGKSIRLWNPATGKRLRELDHTNYMVCLVYSPDGKMLASVCGDNYIWLWEVAGGRLRYWLLPDLARVDTLAFSADGEVLIARSAEALCVWDVVTGEELRHFRDTPDQPRIVNTATWLPRLLCSPDGKRIVSRCADATLLVWDVESCRKPRPRMNLPVKELETLWGALQSDAGEAFLAMRKLISAPEQSVPLFAKRLRPALKPETDGVAQLLADLGSERFAVRQQAEGALIRIGEVARPVLEKALASSPSLEQRRRLESVLDRLGKLDAETLRGLRAVEVLEYVATPEARQLLQTLAKGSAEARLTREARLSLERMASVAE